MNLWRILVIIHRFLFVPPQRLIACTFGFLAIVNAFVLRHCTDMVLPTIPKVTSLKSPGNQSQILSKLKEHLNFNPPERLSCGDCIKKLKKPPDNLSTDNMRPEQVRALIMVSFYMGYVVTHMSGVLLAKRFGSKRILAIALAFTSFCLTITSPFLSYCGLEGLIFINLFIGLSEGPVFPALGCLVIEGMPPSEGAYREHTILVDGHIGIFLVNLASGGLLPYLELSLVLYTFGACALIWFIILIIFCFNGLKPNLSIDEVMHSLHTISESTLNTSSDMSTISPPWWHIFTSPSTWTLIFTTIKHDWAQSLVVSELRKLFEDLRDTNFWDNCCSCLKIVLPFLLNWLISFLLGLFNDILLNCNIVDINESRNLAILIATVAPRISVDFTSCILSNENSNFTTVLNCMLAVMSTYYADIKVSSLDSPNWATMDLAKELGSIANIIAPYMDNLIREEGGPVQNFG